MNARVAATAARGSVGSWYVGRAVTGGCTRTLFVARFSFRPGATVYLAVWILKLSLGQSAIV